MTAPDEKEQILIAAEAATRKAYADTNTVDDLRKWKAAERALMEYRDGAATGRKFKNVAEVYRYLLKEGWNTTDRTVRNHARLNYLVETRGGGYLIDDVERYAQTYLHKPGGQQDGGAVFDMKDRFLKAQAEEKELKVAQLKNRLLDAEEEAERDAAILLGVRRHLEVSAPDRVKAIISDMSDILTDDQRGRLAARMPEIIERDMETIADIFDRLADAGGVEA